MTKRNQDFTMWRGDRKNIIIQVVDSEENVVNITGASIVWIMLNPINELDKSTAGGGIVLSDAPNGEFTIVIMPSDTEDFEGEYYYHEAEVTDYLGNVSTVTVGSVALMQDAIPAYVEAVP